MASKQRKARKILDWWTDPRKPLWPRVAGMLLPFAVCAFGVGYGLSPYLAISNSETTEGIVVSLIHQTDRDGSYHMAVAEYTVAEKKYQCDGGAWWSGPGGHAVGDRVKIRYDATDPKTAIIDSFRERWFFSAFVVATGLIIEGCLL